MVRVRGLCLG